MPPGVGTPVVVLDRGAAEADLVVELAGPEDILSRKTVGPVHAARLANPDLYPEAGQFGPFIARHAVAEEARVLQRLAAALHLRVAEQGGIGRVDDESVASFVRAHARHDRCRHATDGHGMVAALVPRKVVVTVFRGHAHELVQPVLGNRTPPVQVDVGHPERGR